MYVNLLYRFTSDHTNRSRGFKLEYNTVEEGGTYLLGACGGNFSTPHGLLTSPSYPTNYPDLANCTYVVTLPPERYIKLTIYKIDIHCPSPELDYLEMRDGNSEDSPLMVRFCGNGTHIPAYLVTSQNSLWMRYCCLVISSHFVTKVINNNTRSDQNMTYKNLVQIRLKYS